MPKIREYNNTQDFSGDPVAGAARSQEQAGYYGGAAIRQGFEGLSEGIKGAEQHIAQNETSKLAADLATAHAELAEQWRDAVQHADPNDHELASRFMEQKVKPRLAGLGDGLITEQAQQAHERASAGLTAELFTKSAADQANLAGEAAIANLDTMKNQYSNVVRNDPTALASVQALTEASVRGMVASHNLPAEAGIKLTNQVLAENAKSAAYGAADINPDAAIKDAQDGKYDKWLDGTQVKGVLDYAEGKKRTDAAAQRAADTEQRRLNSEAAEQFAGNITAKAVDEDTGQERLQPDYFKSANDYRKLPGAKLSTYNELVSAGERILNNPLTHDAPGVVPGLLGRITSGQAPSRDEILSHVGRDLSQSSANFIMDQMKETPQNRTTTQLITQTLTEARETLGVGRKDIFGQLNPLAQRDYSTFEAWFLPNLQKQLKAGKDPAQLLNAESPEYMLKDQVPFRRFMSHPADQVQSTLQQYAPQKPPTMAKRPSLDDIFGK